MFGITLSTATDSKVVAIRGEDKEGSTMEGRVLVLTAGAMTPVRLFGTGLSMSTSLRFTPDSAARGDNCDDMPASAVYDPEEEGNSTALYQVNMDELYKDESNLYICVQDGEGGWVHMGDDPWLAIRVKLKEVKTTMLPVPIQSILLVVLLLLSGLFSGLNLGLMSLDKNDLLIIENVGTKKERGYAKKISPLRKRGNFLLCTILLGNVLVNNTLTILMDDLTGSGMIAVVIATMGIVVFGEIIPQAVCSRYGLAIGAKTAWITKFFMLATFPLSFPISLILDCALGDEIGNVYNRDRLRELLKVTQGDMDLVKDEVNIIAGALELSKKTVSNIMTKLEDVYMLEYSSTLDFDQMNEIMKTGYSRIPVYEKERTNIISVLYIKDLAFVDPDDAIPLTTVCKFYQHSVNYVFEDNKLDVMLDEFKKGRSHMAFVQIVNNEGEGDPFYETIGVVTLEDVIEEIIQSEIVDETDIVSDNRFKTKIGNKTHRDFSVFTMQPDAQHYARLTPQLSLATFQYLSTTVSSFHSEHLSENVLQKLIKQHDIIHDISMKDGTPAHYVYTQGKTCDYFVLLLQGHMEVEVGSEKMMFDAGPFMYFGIQALTLDRERSLSFQAPKNSGASSSLSVGMESLLSGKQVTHYQPDYSLKASSDVLYLKIHRHQYIAACRATQLERLPPSPNCEGGDDPFKKEWDRAISEHPEMANNLSLQDAVINASMKHDEKEKSPKHRALSSISDAATAAPSKQDDGKQAKSTLNFSPPEYNAVSKHSDDKNKSDSESQGEADSSCTPLVKDCDSNNAARI